MIAYDMNVPFRNFNQVRRYYWYYIETTMIQNVTFIHIDD